MTKSREIPAVWANRGPEKATRDLLIEAYERIAGLEQSVAEMAEMQLRSFNLLAQVVDGADAMRTQVERLQGRKGDDDDDLPPMAS